MDISKFAVSSESYSRLSDFQISKFFNNASVTKNQCDEFATKLIGDGVSATPVQGGNSYTVEGQRKRKVVQFRSLPLDVVKLGIVQQVYYRFAPQGEYYGLLETLHVYIWEHISGSAFCRVRRKMFAPETLDSNGLSQTVRDFARFFASAWLNQPQLPKPLPMDLHESYAVILDKLSATLPGSLQSTVHRVRENLDLLFRPEYPFAIQHGDILENNIHVDEGTGHITGIVDWHDAFIAPFGISLGGAEILFGIETNGDWHFHQSHLELRQLFWETFNTEVGELSESDRQTMEIARLMGLFKAYGSESNGAVILERLILHKMN